MIYSEDAYTSVLDRAQQENARLQRQIEMLAQEAERVIDADMALIRSCLEESQRCYQLLRDIEEAAAKGNGTDDGALMRGVLVEIEMLARERNKT